MNISRQLYLISIIYCLIVLEARLSARASKIRSSGSESKGKADYFLTSAIIPYFSRTFRKINYKYVTLIAFTSRIKD